MASRKRPLDTQASVWVLMRSVKVPHGEDWGDAPHLQVALSGVFATKELAEKACAEHQKALAAFCEKQSKQLESEEKEELEEQYGCDFSSSPHGPGHFESQLCVVEMPVLTESPPAPEFKVEGQRVVNPGAPKHGFRGPMSHMDGYDTQKPASYCRILGERDCSGPQYHSDDDEEGGEQDEEGEEDEGGE